MKFATTVISILVFATQAYAGFPGFRPTPVAPTPVQPIAIAPLTVNVHVAGDTAQFGNANAAHVIVDKENDKLVVELYLDRCSSMFPTGGMSCRAEASPLATYEVRLEKIRDGACGSIIYQGSEDKRPVDGAKVSVVVIDDRAFSKHCTAVRAQPLTSGYLKVEIVNRMTGTNEEKSLSFEGGLLK